MILFARQSSAAGLRKPRARPFYRVPGNFPPCYFYHLVFDANRESILKYGLLSSEALVTQAGYSASEREGLLGRQRTGNLALPNGVVLRDQSPMPPTALAKALPPEVSPADWYRLLNRFVFLWADPERVQRHWRAGGGRGQALFIFDAPRLLEELGERICVSAINSGNARRSPAPRAPETLVPYPVWRESGWPEYLGRRRPRSAPPVEILVRDRLPLEPYLLGSIASGELSEEHFAPERIALAAGKRRGR